MTGKITFISFTIVIKSYYYLFQFYCHHHHHNHHCFSTYVCVNTHAYIHTDLDFNNNMVPIPIAAEDHFFVLFLKTCCSFLQLLTRSELPKLPLIARRLTALWSAWPLNYSFLSQSLDICRQLVGFVLALCRVWAIWNSPRSANVSKWDCKNDGREGPPCPAPRVALSWRINNGCTLDLELLPQTSVQ